MRDRTYKKDSKKEEELVVAKTANQVAGVARIQDPIKSFDEFGFS